MPFGQAVAITLLWAMCASGQTNPAEAIRALQAELRADPGRADLHYQRALAYLGIEDLADAETEFRDALGGMPDRAATHNYHGTVLLKVGNSKPADAEFR